MSRGHGSVRVWLTLWVIIAGPGLDRVGEQNKVENRT